MSLEGTRCHWKERIHSLTALEGGSYSTRGIGRSQEEEYFSGCSVARVSAPEVILCLPGVTWLRPVDTSPGRYTQNWSLRYVHLDRPADWAYRTDQGVGCFFY